MASNILAFSSRWENGGMVTVTTVRCSGTLEKWGSSPPLYSTAELQSHRLAYAKTARQPPESNVKCIVCDFRFHDARTIQP